MNNFLWFEFNWPLLLVVLALVVSGIIASRQRLRPLGLLALGLTFYFAFKWHLPQNMEWLKWIFWILFWGALIASVVSTFRRFARRRVIATALAAAVALIGFGFANSGAPAFSRGENPLTLSLQQQLQENAGILDEYKASLEAGKKDREEFCKQESNKVVCDYMAANDAKNAQQDTKDAEQDKRLDDHDKALKDLQGRVASLEKVTKEQTVVPSQGKQADPQATKGLGDQLAGAGWKSGEVKINNVDENMHREESGDYPFSKRLRTKSELVKYLNGDSAASKATRDVVLKNTPTEAHQSILDGSAYYALQFTEDVCVEGNTYFENNVVKYGKKRCFSKGDVLWVPVVNDVPYWGGTIRDDCANVHIATAPAPKGSKQAEVCPKGTDRAGQMVGAGCNYKKASHVTRSGSSKPSSGSTPPKGGSKPPQPSASKTTNPPTSKPPTTNPPTSTPPTSKPPTSKPPTLNPKNPNDDVNKNQKVEDYKKSTDGSAKTNRNDGSKDSQGLQTNPGADATKAAEKAQQSQEQSKKEHQQSKDKATTSGGGKVDNNQTNAQATQPAW